jgi:hypothetical protein
MRTLNEPDMFVRVKTMQDGDVLGQNILKLLILLKDFSHPRVHCLRGTPLRHAPKILF